MVGAKQLEHFRAKRLVTATRTIDERRALVGGKVYDGVEHGIDAAEPIGR
jgi:hypothetical protein